MLSTFLRALVLGFSVAAPVGPIGILCIRRTLTDGRAVGFACGLGAATADTLYGLAAGVGLSAFSSAIAAVDGPMRLGGGLYLGWLGVRTFVAPPSAEAAAVSTGARWSAWWSTFVLTLTNPATILAFAAMFAAIVPTGGGGPAWQLAPVLAGGVFLGSAAWWLLLSGAADRLRTRLGPAHLVWVNRAAGVMLVGFAAWALGSLALAQGL
jgi:threonine/homoserine/homoserine lactone efflux protein